MSAIKAINIDGEDARDCQANKNRQNSQNWTHHPVTLDNWVAACHEEKMKLGISYAEIARRIHYKRPSLSLALSGNYTGSTKTIAAAYVAYRKQVACPYTSDIVSRQYCRDHALGAAPTHNPSSLRHWRACQGCKHKPEEAAL